MTTGPDPGSRTGASALQMVLRRGLPRSKYYDVRCFGTKRHYRKDGTCVHTDAILASVKPAARGRVAVKPFGGKS